MGLFSKLFGRFLPGRIRAALLAELPPEATKTERIRQTAADEHQARKKASEAHDSITALKAKIAAESAKILEDLGKPFAADMERDRAESLKRQAATEKRIEDDKPENRFLRGDYKLTLNIDFRSSNPADPAVYQVWYVAAEKAIYVTFYEGGGAGRTYKYWTITTPEALNMYRASSKGIHVWDAFRIRGTKYGHKKNYALVG